MANLTYPVPPDFVFYPDGPVFLSCGLRIMDVKYGPNPQQKKKNFLIYLLIYLL